MLRPTSQDRSSSFHLGHFPTEEETQKSVFLTASNTNFGIYLLVKCVF